MSSTIVSRYLANELLRAGGDLAIVDQLLPEAIKDMAGKIGYQNALQVVAKVGGSSWYVPVVDGSNGEVGVEARAKMARALGSEALAGLIRKHYEGQVIYIASCDIAMRALRDIAMHKIVEDGFLNGRSLVTMVQEMAIQFGLSDRRIWDILKAPSPATTLQPSIHGQVTKVRHASN